VPRIIVLCKEIKKKINEFASEKADKANSAARSTVLKNQPQKVF
jgi:hypothetical protein